MRHRAALAALALALAVPLSAAQAPAGSEVDIVRVERPTTVVGDKTWDLTVHLVNHANGPRTVYLFTALYAWKPGTPCGPATDERYRGFVHLVQAVVRLEPGGEARYPTRDTDLPWHHRANASQIGSDAKLEVCVFAAEGSTGQSATLTYHDYANFTVAARAFNTPPDASFTWSPEAPRATLPVAFTAAGSDPDGDAVSFTWDFGHANASGQEPVAGARATHAFYPEGRYTVTLTATDGWDSRSVSREVRVLDEPAPGEEPTPPPPERKSWIPAPALPVALALALAVALARGRGRR